VLCGSLLHGTGYSVTGGSSTPTPGAMAVTSGRRPEAVLGPVI
jgi:hypothetical protein